MTKEEKEKLTAKNPEKNNSRPYYIYKPKQQKKAK
jgi:hypothetical protein